MVVQVQVTWPFQQPTHSIKILDVGSISMHVFNDTYQISFASYRNEYTYKGNVYLQ